MHGKMKKVGKILGVIFVCMLFFLAAFLVVKMLIHVLGEKSESGFLASTENEIQLYIFKNEAYQKEKMEKRGTKVSIYEREYSDGSATYVKIKLGEKIYYVLKGFVTTEKEKIVKEKTLYVRTPTTLYQNTSSSILSFLKKGTPLEVTGYHTLLDDGSVYMYKVKAGNKEGYVYSKYVVQTEKEALQHYNEKGIYDIHKVRGDTYGGGSAGNLDYYPSEKVSFSSNKMPEEVRALFIDANAIQRIDDYITLAKKSNINAFVIDIKSEVPSFASSVISTYSPSSYKKAVHTLDAYKSYVKRAISEGFYVIGRICVFQDPYYAIDHPEDAILDTRTGNSFSYHNTFFPTPYSREVWEYNVELAREAALEIGFHEIQFDSLSFPEGIGEYEKSGAVNLHNNYDEEKAGALQQFLFYARDALHEIDTYVSATLSFKSVDANVTSYGQYFPAMANVVDAIYIYACPDLFDASAYGVSSPTMNPYLLLTSWSAFVLAREKETPSFPSIRLFIQAYDSTKEPYISYDENKVSDQIRALYDSKLSYGYVAFHNHSSLEKYTAIAPAFQKEYKHE